MNTTRIAHNVVLPLLLFLLFTAPVHAQEKDKSAALREDLEKRLGDKVDIRFDRPYADNENRFQMLDLYLPKQRADDKPLPVVVYIHGGGWSGGDRKGYAGAAAGMASTGQYATASVGYRLSAEAKWPAQIHDCKAAIRWIRGHAKELNLDPDRIGVTGGSAGGHLSTLLGLTGDVKDLEGDVGKFNKESSRVTCVVNVCGPSDLTTPLMQGDAAKTDDPAVVGLIGGNLQAKLDTAKAASPLTYVTSQATPIMTIHGTQDLRVNFTNAERLDAALKKVGATTLLIPVTDAGHGVPMGRELTGRVLQFWDMYLRGVKSEISTLPIQAPPAATPPKK